MNVFLIYPWRTAQSRYIFQDQSIIVGPLLVSDSTKKDEEEKEEPSKPAVDNDYRIGDTKESRLFRKFLISWDSYFCSKHQQPSLGERSNSGGKERRNMK